MFTSDPTPRCGQGEQSSEPSAPWRKMPDLAAPDATTVGFTLLEVLLALSLTLTIAAAALPAWISLQSRQVAESDRVIALLQSRVAAARLERDLRLATVGSTDNGVCGPVVFGDEHLLVLLTRTGSEGLTEFVGWEVTPGRLMRRRASWTGTMPESAEAILYFDHKTMLEGVASDTAFRYRFDGRPASVESVDAGNPLHSELSLLDRVVLEGQISVPGSTAGVPLRATGEIGR